MLSNDKKQILNQLISGLSASELIWASGYLAGLAGLNNTASSASDHKISGNLTLFYITETGNSKFLAAEISKRLKASGANVKIKASDQYRLNDLEKESNIVFFISTHGDGEMPASGKKILDYINENERDLSKLNYGVIALGDTSYPLFCQSGKDVDKILEEKKAKRIFSRLDLDLDFDQKIEEVESRILTMLKGHSSTQIITHKISQFAAKKEFEGEVILNINLNDVGSIKETRHIEIAIPEDVAYEPGDAIAVVLVGEKEVGTTTNVTTEIAPKIAPRLYSIASSLNEHGNEVHLTVSVVNYVDDQGKATKGLASGYLSDLKPGDKLQLYVSKNRQFKLPADDKDVIMVGPGTGIAPFRAFVAERNFRSASGKNWLFFGECNFQTDFLYQTEWQSHLDSGTLSKLDVAFSRDQEKKIYVQNRILESSSELFKWLDSGAYFYVCGDKLKMAADVENALLTLIAKEGKKTEEQAQEYLNSLAEEGRYLKDVY